MRNQVISDDASHVQNSKLGTLHYLSSSALNRNDTALNTARELPSSQTNTQQHHHQQQQQQQNQHQSQGMNMLASLSTTQWTPQSQIRKYSPGDGINVTNCETQSYMSSTTTGTTGGILHLQNRLNAKTSPPFVQSEDYEEGESICYHTRDHNEILEDEVFMTALPVVECHQSKLSWDKENRDFFHKIKNMDTGREYDVRVNEELEEIYRLTPRIHVEHSTGWTSWWEKKRRNEHELEKACKLNLTESIIAVISNCDTDLMPNLNCSISNEGWTPLHFAAFFGNTAICNLFIQKDAYIDSENALGQTPLILSCIENKQDVASLLIENGANVNAQDAYLNTPLHYCFLNGDKDLLDIVLRKPYLDMNMRNANSMLAWQETENEELVKYFKQQVSKKEQQRNIKEQMRIIEYADEDICQLFSNHASFLSLTPRINMASITSDFSQYAVEGLLGKGTFGEVYLVKERTSGNLYALKLLHKNQIMESSMYNYAITERNILQIVDHPFITKLKHAFQTKDKLFFLMENGQQGDLLQHLKKEKKFSESKAQFYAAETLLALEYLHGLDIMYRDLKASNILIAADGHIRLSDFGLSKEGVREYDRGARSFCGSVAYMPPEILRNQGHGKSIDIYLLGVLIYEMLTGNPPFYGKDENTIYNNIQMSQLKFPTCVSRTAKSLLIKLLSKDPRFRPTPDQIKRHPFFSGVNWKQLLLKNVQPPKSIQKKQNIFNTTEDIFIENGEINISPARLRNIKQEIEVNEQKKTLFNKWTFIANS